VFGALGKTFNAVSNLIVIGRNRGMRNDYESKLRQKDIALRQRENVLAEIKRLVGGGVATEGTQSVRAHGVGGNVAMWIEKLGNGSPSNILRFLAEKSGLKFTRSQVALGTGLSANSRGYAATLALLKRNHLIVTARRGDLNQPGFVGARRRSPSLGGTGAEHNRDKAPAHASENQGQPRRSNCAQELG
jgi:hypothetical protein